MSNGNTPWRWWIRRSDKRKQSPKELIQQREPEMIRRVFYIASIATMVVAILAARHTAKALVPAAPPAAGAEVKIDNFSFSPATITVAAGTQVTWTNRDDIPHTVAT